MRSIADRFWAKVDKTGDCWLWTAASDSHGYGCFYVARDAVPTKQPAHRVSWALANGPIAAGLFVDHLCFTPNCVRPSHLRNELYTHNSVDRRAAS